MILSATSWSSVFVGTRDIHRRADIPELPNARISVAVGALDGSRRDASTFRMDALILTGMR